MKKWEIALLVGGGLLNAAIGIFSFEGPVLGYVIYGVLRAAYGAGVAAVVVMLIRWGTWLVRKLGS